MSFYLQMVFEAHLYCGTDDAWFLNTHWPCVCLGGVFERQVAVSLWSDRAAAGEAAGQTVHSDSIQSKVSKGARLCVTTGACLSHLNTSVVPVNEVQSKTELNI